MELVLPVPEVLLLVLELPVVELVPLFVPEDELLDVPVSEKLPLPSCSVVAAPVLVPELIEVLFDEMLAIVVVFAVRDPVVPAVVLEYEDEISRKSKT